MAIIETKKSIKLISEYIVTREHHEMYRDKKIRTIAMGINKIDL
jgi:hypothetical protein